MQNIKLMLDVVKKYVVFYYKTPIFYKTYNNSKLKLHTFSIFFLFKMNSNTMISLAEFSSFDEMSQKPQSLQINSLPELSFQKKISRNKLAIKNKKKRYFFPLGVFLVTIDELQSPKI